MSELVEHWRSFSTVIVSLLEKLNYNKKIRSKHLGETVPSSAGAYLTELQKLRVFRVKMNVVASGIKITAQNSLKRLQELFIRMIKRAGALLLKLPLASIKFLSRIGNFLLDSRNKKVVVVLLTTAALLIASRTLVNRANRVRL